MSDDQISAKAALYLSRLIPPGDKVDEHIARMWAIEEERDLARLLAPLRQGIINA